MLTVPKAQRDPLGWIATGLLAAPAVVAAAWGAYRLVIGTASTRPKVVSRFVPIDGPPPPDTLPTRATVDLLFLIVWVLAVNLVIPGLILGWIRLRRLGRNPGRLIATLLAGTAASVVVTFWGWGQLTSPQASGLVMLGGAALAPAAAWFVLRPKEPAPASAAR